MNSFSSPVNSPNTQYVPSFLLGEPEVNNDYLSRAQLTPEKMNTSPRYNSSVSDLHLTPMRPNYNHGAKTVHNGPPICSLLDEEIRMKENPTEANSTWMDRTDASVESEGHWIVVYGFPPSASSHVLSIFSQLGQVLEHSYPTSGNWIFLKFGNRADVRKALSYNERIINQNIMIGVSERKNVNQMRLSCPTSPNNVNMSLNSSVVSPKIRQLGLPRRDLQNQPTPQKDTSMVTKVLDFVLGW